MRPAGHGSGTLGVFCTTADTWGKKPKVVGMPYKEDVSCCGDWPSLLGTTALTVWSIELWEMASRGGKGEAVGPIGS